MRVLLVDNYDSFTYNLYQYVGELLSLENKDFELKVIRNDEWSFEQIREAGYEKIIISPGPGTPTDQAYFGVCQQVIGELGQTTPVLGVCLGMQGVAYAFGGEIVRAPEIKHGKTSLIAHDQQGLFRQLPTPLEAMRYHSLIPEPKSIPSELEITATNQDSPPEFLEIMGLRHKQYPVWGIQFHPESFATEGGKQILRNFLDMSVE
jgi:anthranilate synthase component 2